MTGQTWVAGEDGAEFFLQIKHTNPGTDTSCKIAVDGEHLTSWRMRHDNHDWSSKLGAIKRGQSLSAGDQGIMHALRFQRVGQSSASRDDQEDEDESRLPTFGSVEAKWYRTVKTTQLKSTVNTKGFGGSSAASIGGDKASKKEGAAALRSTAGSVPTTFVESKFKSTLHEQLGAASIRFTSEFGLAVRGLLRDEDASAPADGGALPRAKRSKRDERAAGSSSSAGPSSTGVVAGPSSAGAICGSSSAASSSATTGPPVVLELDSDGDGEQKPRPSGFAHGEVIELSDDD